jgi:hypothetical protein
MKQNVFSVISKIKKYKKLRYDAEVARELRMQRSNLSDYKARGEVPIKQLKTFAEREGISLDWLLDSSERQSEPDLAYQTDISRPQLVVEDKSMPFLRDPLLQKYSAQISALLDVMDSENEIMKRALESNLFAFQSAVKESAEKNRLKQQVTDTKEEMQSLRNKLEMLEKMLHSPNPNTKAKGG